MSFYSYDGAQRWGRLLLVACCAGGLLSGNATAQDPSLGSAMQRVENRATPCGHIEPAPSGLRIQRSQAPDIILRAPVAEKWLSLGGPTSLLGCPTASSEVRPFNTGRESEQAVEYAIAPFQSGGIIENPAAGGTFYISEHFDQLRRRLETPSLYNIGLPASDPMSGEGIAEWQLFQVPGSRDYNMLEMRIDPPTLFVSRHPVVSPAWFPIDPADSTTHQDTERIENWVREWAADRTAAPKWESFTCQTINGPCLQTRYDVPRLPNSGSVCGWTATPLGPPEWQPLLHAFNAGGEWIDRGVDAEQLHKIMQEDPLRALDIMIFNGRPSSRDWGDGLRAGNRPIFWYSSRAEGIVTNSHLAGSDFGFTHRSSPRGWDLGDTTQVYYRGECNPVESRGLLCNDWNVFMRLDPEYNYMLAAPGTCRPHPAPRPLCYACCDGRFSGNARGEDIGTLETEVEQWQVPGGFRPEIGDRMTMTGRWMIDCGHDGWSAELHPIETFVTRHNPVSEQGDQATLTKVIVTSAWLGSRRTPDGQFSVGATVLDLYPPARPSPDARLVIEQELAGFGIQADLQPVPAENPNYYRLTLRMTVDDLLDMTQGNRTGQGFYGDLFYANNRRLVGTFLLRWQ